MKSLTILITGATAGIGRDAALALAKKGHTVIATGRRVENLDALVASASSARAHSATGTIHGIRLDVTDARSIEALHAEVTRLTNGRGVDVLVNNAGYGLVGPLSVITDEDLRTQFDTNVFGLMAMTRTFLPAMRERRFGRIVNVGSMGGRVTFPLMGAYHATKYAIEAMSDALRNELAPFGVGVSLVEPGAINTEFNDRALGSLSKYQTPDSPYAAIFDQADAMRAKFEATAVGTGPVVDAIVHACESRRPRARYVVPFRTHFGLLAFRILPTSWMDAILRAALGLTKKRLAPPRLAQATQSHAN